MNRKPEFRVGASKKFQINPKFRDIIVASLSIEPGIPERIGKQRDITGCRFGRSSIRIIPTLSFDLDRDLSAIITSPLSAKNAEYHIANLLFSRNKKKESPVLFSLQEKRASRVLLSTKKNRANSRGIEMAAPEISAKHLAVMSLFIFD